ncbi:hypothetical protein Vadar_026208 [Vaccinium darrowii]|uniref:Uncharacterized protein n=1 Tax=Vaccinium darrowii TaxID=229202 RepID=A0ACB7Z710_9ERIC|nr:hypothetical protein Vadar_026208 [Vaccinium darrowii]
MPFGYDRRRLSVEWSRGDRFRGRHHDDSRSMPNSPNQRPTNTFFVINYDPGRTRFETQEDATKALECTHMSQILDRAVSVEYALRDDDEREGRNDSLRAGYGRRGDSPVYRWAQPSPDYGGPTAQCMTDAMVPHMIKSRSPRMINPESGFQ